MHPLPFPCPVCSTPCAAPPLHHYSATQAATHFCPPTRNLDRFQRLEASIRKLWQGDECVALRCGSCGFGFGYPFVGGDETFYGILHEQKGYPSWRWDYDYAIKEALANVPTGKVLDIGAGIGAFLHGLGGDWQLYAVESTESNRGDLEKRGVQVFRELEQAATEHAGTFQAITMFQVLEHIAEFAPVLKSCRSLLRSGGYIVITVPDGDAMERQERLTGCADMPPNHINKWTPNSLRIALEAAGFEVLKTTPEPSNLKSLLGAMHMRIQTDAANPKSLAAQVYRIQNKRVRVPLLALLGLPALLRLSPHALQLIQGGAFGIIAKIP